MSKSFGKRIFGYFAAILLVIIVAGSVVGYLYWRSLVKTPQYSIALIVDAARNNDEKTANELIDIDSVVEDFLPQIVAKAVELYGRGLPPQMLAKAELAAAPLMPAVKERARSEIPKVIRSKTKQLENVPFAALVFGADRYLDIELNGDIATVKSVRPQDSFILKMRRNGDKWVIVGLSDEKLAENIARRIGQELMHLAASTPDTGNSQEIIKNFSRILEQSDEMFK